MISIGLLSTDSKVRRVYGTNMVPVLPGEKFVSYIVDDVFVRFERPYEVTGDDGFVWIKLPAIRRALRMKARRLA